MGGGARRYGPPRGDRCVRFVQCLCMHAYSYRDIAALGCKFKTDFPRLQRAARAWKAPCGVRDVAGFTSSFFLTYSLACMVVAFFSLLLALTLKSSCVHRCASISFLSPGALLLLFCCCCCFGSNFMAS